MHMPCVRWTWLVTLLVWWWLMMAVHELGHVLGCLVSGATIEAVVLWPWTISETVRSGSTAPLVDTASGPIVGVVLPMLLWLTAYRWRHAPWVGGWAGFCCVANGVYLGLGWIDAVGDAGDLMRLGVPGWGLALGGGLMFIGGIWLWHALLERHRHHPG